MAPTFPWILPSLPPRWTALCVALHEFWWLRRLITAKQGLYPPSHVHSPYKILQKFLSHIENYEMPGNVFLNIQMWEFASIPILIIVKMLVQISFQLVTKTVHHHTVDRYHTEVNPRLFETFLALHLKGLFFKTIEQMVLSQPCPSPAWSANTMVFTFRASETRSKELAAE